MIKYKYRAFIGDLHGSIKALESALDKIDLETTEVFFLGDYVDRGKESKKVLEKLMELSERDNVHCILGNHDAMLLDFIETGDPLGLVNDPQLNTFKSFFPDRTLYYNSYYSIFDENNKDITLDLRMALSKETSIAWLKELPLFLLRENQIIVHAGVDKTLDNWMLTESSDFYWIRPNLKIKNKTGKDIIMGHTVTYKFMKEYSLEKQPPIYISKETNEYFIDTYNYFFENARVLFYDIDEKKYFSE